MTTYKIFPKERRSIIGIAIFFAISYFWTLIAGPYQDDKTRQLWGGDNWSDVGRPLADIITWPFKINDRLSDITPLSQIVSITLITISIILCKHYIKRSKSYSWLAFGIMFANAFYIQNMSYRFDNQIMTLSFFCSIVPAILLASECKTKSLAPVSIILFLASLCLYQAAINAGLVISGLWVFKKSNEENSYFAVKRIAVLLGCLAISLAIYKIILLISPVNGGYGEKNSGTLSISTLIPGAIHNYYEYSRYAFKLNKLYVSIVIITGILVLAIALWDSFRSKEFKEIFTKFFGLGIMFCGAFGILLILSHQALVPRVYMGFGALAAALCFIIVDYRVKAIRFLGYIALAVLSYNFLFYSSVYGNVLKSVNQYESETIPNINLNADILAQKHNIKNVAMVGVLENPYRVEKQVSNSKLISRMIDKPITNYMSARNAYYFYGGTLNYDTSYKGKFCQLPIEESYPLYDLRVGENNVIIVFKGSC